MFVCLFVILGIQTTCGDWLSSSHIPDRQSEPGIPESELYNVNMPALLLAVYLYQLLVLSAYKRGYDLWSTFPTVHFLGTCGTTEPLSVASILLPILFPI